MGMYREGYVSKCGLEASTSRSINSAHAAFYAGV